MDVIALHQAGFDNAVASLGTSLTSGHASLLKRYTKEVYLTYDSDGAGVKGGTPCNSDFKRSWNYHESHKHAAVQRSG